LIVSPALIGRATLVIATVLACAGPAGAQRAPNIVIIVTDDMGYADIGVHGSTDIPTPNIDALAASGVRFTDAYVSGPYCSPTRAALLTGKYQQRFGHEFNILGLSNTTDGLPLDQKTIADHLRAAGYRTALFGKWHLGAGDAYHPMNRGFDEFFGFLEGQHSYHEAAPAGRPPLYEGRRAAKWSAYLTDELAERASEFIARNQARPFMLYLAFNAVHTPLEASPKYLARFPHIKDPTRRTYAAMLSAMDDAVGRTMATLRAQNLEANTLVFFFNDNGGPMAEGTTINGSSNAPLRGAKRQTFEGGIRVPFFISWKGVIPAGTVDARPVIQLDVMPTALRAAGVDVPAEWRLDGVDLMPYLTGRNADAPHDALYWRLGSQMAIRRGDWKLVLGSDGPLTTRTRWSAADLRNAELFDLRNDLRERTNLAGREPAKVKELAELWLTWNAQLVQPLWGVPAADRGR
jgi:arylsulfatase A-like enzyme